MCATYTRDRSPRGLPALARPAAFTLIELLVVISILSVLMAILMPALSGARDQAKTVVCMANLRAFGTSFHSYAAANKGFLTSGQADARPGMNYAASIRDLNIMGIERVGWIADLVNSENCFPGRMLCPTNPGRQTQSWGRALAVPGASALYTPREFLRLRDTRDYNTNYCQSWYMIHTQYDGTSKFVFNRDRMRGSMGPLRVAMMSKAGEARVPLIGDARAPKNETFDHAAQGYGPAVRETKSATDGPGWKLEEDGSFTMAPYSSFTPYGIQDWDDFGPAHRKKRNVTNDEEHGYTAGNILFGDGHVAIFRDQFDFDNGRVKHEPDGELDSWDLRGKVFDGVLTLGRRSRSVERLD